jgi:hypothetical protein
MGEMKLKPDKIIEGRWLKLVWFAKTASQSDKVINVLIMPKNLRAAERRKGEK